jgi:hypothetical protein
VDWNCVSACASIPCAVSVAWRSESGTVSSIRP